ncbi:MAG TPA: type II secretion system minor pseudopilin GspK [Steroidobacteraceae bacterium]|jgi:general secretion pathway protein K|nr:type II secretion system minor pseudopilin GspK [Steroidobacteraceae bacterium]
MAARRIAVPPARRAQQGIALITAIVLVAIATVLATSIGFAAVMVARRASATYGADQALLAAEGAEDMAGYVLMQSGATSGSDSPDQVWAQPYGPYPLAPDVTLQFAQIEDQQGKFNLNNLADGGSTDQESVQEFQRLLQLVGLEPKWAALMADWIDNDNMPNDPDGAEDNVYLGQTPPYRPPNMPVTSISELMALPGFGRDRFNRIAPYISALPGGTTINLCTAKGQVLDALSGKDEYSTASSTLSELRAQGGCHPSVAEFSTSVSPAQMKVLQPRIGTGSMYFRLRTFITIGTARFSLYSLLYVDGAKIRPIIRTFGTE